MYGKSETKNKTIAYIMIWFLVTLFPLTTGSIGTLAFEYYISLYSASAQKCGGVQKNIMQNNKTGKKLISLAEQTQPITGGKAPAAPPITIFWEVLLLSHTVYTNM